MSENANLNSETAANDLPTRGNRALQCCGYRRVKKVAFAASCPRGMRHH